ncbi:GntR family transcriptional regulator [Subtercola sp. YIM 133946]|uniref:GntR family transcriptional regulator n=1 Tax=Subtercola sp. YIM 133946 TaxID=3118909 RepID=UPI002F921F4E
MASREIFADRSSRDDSLHRSLLRLAREAAAAGTALPGEFELIDRLGCTRQQLRNALADLERIGIVQRRQGAATTVDPVGLMMSVRLEEQFEHSELLARLGYRSSVEVLESVPEPLPPHIAALLQVEAGHPSVRTTKRWLADDRPVMLASGYILLPDFEPRMLNDSVFTAVADVWGESLVWEIATPGAENLHGDEARRLEMSEGSAAVTLELIGVAASGRRLFYAFEHHLPEFIRYSLVRTVRPPWSGA